MSNYIDKKHSPTEPNHRAGYHASQYSSSYSAANSHDWYQGNGSPRATYSNGTAFSNGDGNGRHDTALQDYTTQNTSLPGKATAIHTNETVYLPQHLSDHRYARKRTESPPASAYFTSPTFERNSNLRDEASHMMESMAASPDVASHFSFSTTLRRHTHDSVIHNFQSRSERLASGGGFIPAGPPGGIVRRVAATLGLERFLDDRNGEYGAVEMAELAGREGPEPLSSQFAHRTVEVCVCLCFRIVCTDKQ